MLCPRLAMGPTQAAIAAACFAKAARSGLVQHQSMMIMAVNTVLTIRRRMQGYSSLPAPSQLLLSRTACRHTCREGSAGLVHSWVCSLASIALISCPVAAAQHWALGQQVPSSAFAHQVSPAVQCMTEQGTFTLNDGITLLNTRFTHGSYLQDSLQAVHTCGAMHAARPHTVSTAPQHCKQIGGCLSMRDEDSTLLLLLLLPCSAAGHCGKFCRPAPRGTWR